MAILNFAGAEEGVQEIINTGNVSCDTATKRTGAYSFKMPACYTGPGFTNAITLPFPQRSTFFFQGAARRSGTSLMTYDKELLSWRLGSTQLGIIYQNVSTKCLDVYIGPKTTLVGSTPSGLPTAEPFQVIEGKIVLDDSNGIVQIKINGVLVVDYAGDTKSGSEAVCDNIIYGCPGYTAESFWWDDLMVCDDQGSYFNNGCMSAKIHRRPVTGVGNYSQWTPNGAANNWDCVDEQPATTTEYVDTATTGNRDSYALQDAATAAIGAVAVRYWAQGGGNIKRLCRYGSQDYLGDALALPGSFARVEDIMYQKPGGGGWDAATFDSMEIGMEKEADS